MKKQPFPILVTVTCIFAAFTIGLLIGRNTSHGRVQMTNIRTVPIYADKQPELPATEIPVPEETVSYPVNINSASKAELMRLPGIGETLAQRILAYRTEHGSFSSEEELLNVSGIGSSKLEAILDLITTGGNTP